MSEQFPKPEEVKMTREERVALATELSQRPEGFKFPGLEDASYAKLKAEGEEYPGMCTPIDELLAKFQAQGVKIALSKNAATGNMYIIPKDADPNDPMVLENDSVLPRHLKVTEDMDPDLRKLVEADKNK